MQVAPAQVWKTRVLMTVIDGKIVYQEKRLLRSSCNIAGDAAACGGSLRHGNEVPHPAARLPLYSAAHRELAGNFDLESPKSRRRAGRGGTAEQRELAELVRGRSDEFILKVNRRLETAIFASRCRTTASMKLC